MVTPAHRHKRKTKTRKNYPRHKLAIKTEKENKTKTHYPRYSIKL
jgi:hypothetical protein